MLHGSTSETRYDIQYKVFSKVTSCIVQKVFPISPVSLQQIEKKVHAGLIVYITQS